MILGHCTPGQHRRSGVFKQAPGLQFLPTFHLTARTATLAAALWCAPLVSAAAALSAATCTGLPEGQTLLLPAPASQREARSRATEAALTRLALCENDADFLTRLGASLNTLARFEEALEHLERALLLRPDEPLARYSYAWALHELGDSSAARELLTDLSPWAAPSAQRDALARAHRLLLARVAPETTGNSVNASLAGAPLNTAPMPSLAWSGSRSLWQAQWQLTAGHETNLLGSPRATSLNLTITGLPSGETVTINVPLDESVRPRPGPYQQAQGQLRWQQQSLMPLSVTNRNGASEGQGASTHALVPPSAWRLWQWDTLLSVRHRQADSVPGAGFTQVDAAVDLLSRTVRPTATGLQPTAWEPRLNWPDVYATLGATGLRSESGVRYASTQAAAGWQVPWQGACDLRLGGEWQDRRYLSNAILNGRYAGAVGSLRCNRLQLRQAPSTGRTPQWPTGLSLQLRAGQDRPETSARPGGPQQQRGARAGLSAPSWFIEVDHNQQQDRSPYSALIEPGTSRQLRRTTARAEWWQPLPLPGLQLVAGAESSLQHSNIVLFDTRNAGVYLALRSTR